MLVRESGGDSKFPEFYYNFMYFYASHLGLTVFGGKKRKTKPNKIQGATLTKNAQTAIKVLISNERRKQVQHGF